MTRMFAVSFDYRCPFARNLHVGVLAGLAEGRDWQVTFTPFSQDQSHREEGEPPVWEQVPAAWGTGVRPLCWGLAVRDASIVDVTWGAGFVLVAWVARWLGGSDAPHAWLLPVLATRRTRHAAGVLSAPGIPCEDTGSCSARS